MKQKIERFFLKAQDKITLVLLFLLYFLILGPTAIGLRVVRHRKLRSQAFDQGSTWEDTSATPPLAEDYLKQF